MGMQTMETSLQQLVAQGVIDEQYALEGYNY
jgi:Tfp pilus assembly pilus retraction ATPase PilT